MNQVRARAGLAPLAAGLSQTALRTQLMHERITELAGEGVRWFDLQRYGVLTNQAGIDQLKQRDPSFTGFRADRDRLLPLIQIDIDLGRLRQNPNY
nr:RagB/SusD family nutrient uptake outer membrane protein [Hymenobacter lapidarius]